MSGWLTSHTDRYGASLATLMKKKNCLLLQVQATDRTDSRACGHVPSSGARDYRQRLVRRYTDTFVLRAKGLK